MTCKHFRHENFKVVLPIFVISLSFENYVTGGPLMLDWFESSQLPAIGRSRKRKVLLMDIFFNSHFYFPVKLCIYKFLVFLCIYRFPCRQSLVGGRENFSNWKFVCLRSLVSGHLLDSWQKKNCPEFANQRKWPLTEQQNIGARFCQIFISPWDNSTDGHFFQFPWMSAYERVDCAFLKW